MADSFDWLLNDNILPNCSCTECDSMTCFAQRYKCQRENCSCGNCTGSESCQFYPNKKPPCCHSSDSNKQCSCRYHPNSNTNMRTNPAPVKNIICGTTEGKKLGVNQDYYNIYVNKKQLMKSFQSNSATDKLNIYCQSEYKMRKNIQDYYNIYVNQKTSSKQTDTTSLKEIKCNQCNPTTDKFKIYCGDASKIHRNIKDYYDIYVNKKPHSKQTDTATPKEIKCNQCNPKTDKFAIYHGDEYDARKTINNCYGIYVNHKSSSKQADTTLLKHICFNPSNPTTDKFTIYCGDESLVSSTRKSINNCYDICVNKKQSSTQTDPVSRKNKQANPGTNNITFSYGSDCKMRDTHKYYDDIYINGKQSSKNTDSVTLKSTCCTLSKSKQTNPVNDKCSIYYGNEYSTLKNIKKLYDIYVNKKHSSTQTDPVSIKSKQANPPSNNLIFSCGSDSKNYDIHKYYHDIYVHEKRLSKHTDSVTLKPMDCKSKQSNPVDMNQTDHHHHQCKVCGRNICKSYINVNKNQSSNQTDTVTKEYMDCTTTKQIESASGRPHKVKEYETSEYTYDYGGHITTVTKKLSTYLLKAPGLQDYELEKKPKKNITQIQNVSINNDYPYKHSDPSSAKTSAQIMDVLYNDVKESIAINTSKNTPSKTTKLTEYDIIKRIKEAYKACSCKICECVAALTVPNMKDQCNCKPCECIDCKKYQSSIQLMDSKQVPGSGCPCIRCNSSQCKGISDSKREECDCSEDTKDFSKPCLCKPCQCIECKSMYKRNWTWVVDPVDQTSGRNICNCLPCDCIQCTQAIGATSNRTHEISTGIKMNPNCHCEACTNEACIPDDNPSCNCVSHHGVTRKSFSRDSHDYDVRRSSVDKYGKSRKNHDTITMYAAVSNTYPRIRQSHFDHYSHLPPTQNKFNSNTCNGLLYFNDNIITNIKYTQINTPKEIPILLNKNIDNKRKCGCTPCECQICNHNNVIEDGTQDLPNNKYKCNIWDIIRSSTSKCTTTKNTRYLRLCTKNSSENCTSKDMISNENLLPYKRELLIPSICHCKKNDVKDIRTKISSKKSQTTSINIQHECCNLTKCCNFSERHSSELEQQEQLSKKMSRKRSRELNVKPLKNLINCEYDSYTQCKKHNIPTFCDYNNTNDVKMSRNYVSGYSSVANLSKLSHFNENGSIRREHDSWESSCNSSRHDYQDYLFTFPKATVVDYTEDVMKLKIDKDPKLGQISKILSKINTENGKYMKKCNKYQNCKISQVDSIDKKLISSVQNVHNKTGAIIKMNPYKSCSCYYSNLFDKYKAQDFEKHCVHEIGLQTNKSTSISSLLFQDSLKKYTTKEMILPLPENINNTKPHKTVAQNRIQLFDNALIPDKQVESSILNEHNCFWKNGKHSLHNNNMNLFNSDEDFKRAQITLKDARELSSQLMQILARYEKANSEFESLSEKFKHAREPIFNGISKSMRQVEPLNEKECGTNKKEIHQATKLVHENIDDFETNHNVILNLPPIKSNRIISFMKLDAQNMKLTTETVIPSAKSDIHLSLPLAEHRQPNFLPMDIKPTEDFEEYDEQMMNNVPQIMRKYSVRFDSNDDIITSTTIENVQVGKSKENLMDMDEQKVENCMIKTETPIKKSDINLSLTIVEDKKPSSLPIKNIKNRDFEEYDDHSKTNVPQIMRKIGVRFDPTGDIIKCPMTTDNVEVRGSKHSFIDMDKQKMENCMIEKETRTEKSDINLSLTIAEDKSPSSSQIKIITKYFEEYNDDDSKTIVPRVMRKFCVRFGSTKEIIASPTTIDEVRESKYEPEQPVEVLVINQSEINTEPTLTKNLCMHYNGWINNASLLDDTIRMSVNSISMQTSASFAINYELDNSYNENKALVDLQVQASDLLNMPLLQSPNPIIESERFSLSYNSPLQNNFGLQNINHKHCLNGSLTMSSRSSNDSCKVCFRNLHRVSDHTVLVKWQLPKAIDDVQGYELLVDGHPVETLSPSRCMAVVTCLPHSDKVLLTIRTLTTKHTEEGYYPSANIVYRPRIKY